MKKIILISFVVSAMMFFSIKTGTAGIGSQVTALIHYKVNIVNTYLPGQITCPLLVLVTDDRGYIVAPVQIYNPNVSVYNFYERGPVTGTRTAYLMPTPLKQDNVCPNIPPPDTRPDTFYTGGNYLFTIILGNESIIPVPDPQQQR